MGLIFRRKSQSSVMSFRDSDGEIVSFKLAAVYSVSVVKNLATLKYDVTLYWDCDFVEGSGRTRYALDEEEEAFDIMKQWEAYTNSEKDE